MVVCATVLSFAGAKEPISINEFLLMILNEGYRFSINQSIELLKVSSLISGSSE